MQILVVTPQKEMNRVHEAIEVVRGFALQGDYVFELVDFTEFEETWQYEKLMKDKFWPGEYRRLKSGISRIPFSFCQQDIRLIVMSPYHEGDSLVSLMHEMGHIVTNEEAPSKAIRHSIKTVARKFEAKFGKEQLFMQAIHILTFPAEVLADRWVCGISKEVLTKDLQDACRIWGNTIGVTVPYSLGACLHLLDIYLAMNLKRELSEQYKLEKEKENISQLLSSTGRRDLLKLVPEKDVMYEAASKLRIKDYVSIAESTIWGLRKKVPRKAASQETSQWSPTIG